MMEFNIQDIKKCSWDQHRWKAGEGSRSEQKKKSICDTAQGHLCPKPKLWGALELKWSFRVVSNWSKIATALYFHINQLLDVGRNQEGARPWERQLSAS